MAQVCILDFLRLILGLNNNPTAYLSTTIMVLAKDLYSYWILALTTNKKVYITTMIICSVPNITFLTRYWSSKLWREYLMCREHWICIKTLLFCTHHVQLQLTLPLRSYDKSFRNKWARQCRLDNTLFTKLKKWDSYLKNWSM